MAISPLVQQHQRSIIQQSSDSTHMNFNKEFGDAAYELLGAKFPRLLPYIITFKVVDQGEREDDDGSAVGVFVLSRGGDVAYIPVVMSGGSIVSCEMLYSKEDDSMFPIIPKMIKKIISENMTQEHSLVKEPAVENTRQLYTNMFRPPVSSRPVIAGSTDLVSQLPDGAKKALSRYFEENPEMLAKVASFYPVEVLAEKLAVGSGTEKVANEKEIENMRYLDKVIRLEDLTKEAADELSDEAKSEILEVGYAIVEPPEVPVEVLTVAEIPMAAETVLKAAEYKMNSELSGTGKLLRFDGSSLVLERCVVGDGAVFTQEGMYHLNRPSIVLCDFQEGLQLENVVDVLPLKPVSEYKADPGNYGDEAPRHAFVFFPTKTGALKIIRAGSGGLSGCRNIEGYLWLDFGGAGGSSHCFSPDIQVGSFKLEGDSRVFPIRSYLASISRSRSLPTYYQTTMESVTRLIARVCPALQLKKDASDYSVIDRFSGETVKLASEPALVNHLVTKYQFDKKAVDKLLSSGKVHLVKQAEYLPMGKTEMPSGTPLMPAAPRGQLRQGEDESYLIDESVIQDMAEFEDPEMLDTGLVGSLAHADDIKALLIDSVQMLSDAVTELGKSILLFSIKKGEMEAHYGREEFSGVSHSLRTGFTTLGGLVFSIKEYTNNVSYDYDEA